MAGGTARLRDRFRAREHGRRQLRVSRASALAKSGISNQPAICLMLRLTAQIGIARPDAKMQNDARPNLRPRLLMVDRSYMCGPRRGRAGAGACQEITCNAMHRGD